VKFDASRTTFDALKRFRSVLWQQGRVQLDSDSNEQSEIVAHRVETETADVIGLCGAPLHNAAFQISRRSVIVHDETAPEAPNPLVVERRVVPGSSDFLIGDGRYYIDGILCENPTTTSYLAQPDLPGAPPIIDPGWYVIYLDAWLRHITSLDDSSLREIALGGPDTTTRAKVIWQVKQRFAGNGPAIVHCSRDLLQGLARPNGKMSARTAPPQSSTNPCIVPSSAGYKGLENQLYRVEVHFGGNALDVAAANAPIPATLIARTTNQLRLLGAAPQTQAVEIVSTRQGTDPMRGSLAMITAGDAQSQTLNINVAALRQPGLALLPVSATFKWSRDNGVVVTAVEATNGQEVRVHDLGPDAVLGFAEDQWVEFTDDTNELNGTPGTLAKITHIDRATNTITLSAAPPPLLSSGGVFDTSKHQKLRRWDGIAAIKFNSAVSDHGWIDLENGVQIHFEAGSYRTGDYWTFPARTATADRQSGNIEWPADSNGLPIAQPPAGIAHHYCSLAVLHWNGQNIDSLEDCRRLFPPLTELTTLQYVSGDGQQAMPHFPIPQLLQAGVFNGRWPVAGATVRFEANNGGHLAGSIASVSEAWPSSFDAITDAEGVASSAWFLNPDETKPNQQVEAHLLDAEGQIVKGTVVRFNGNHSIAGQVAYNPANCPDLARAGVATVEAALNALCNRDDCECVVCVSPQEHVSRTKTIQAAIEEAKSKGGGKVCLKSGFFLVTEPIVIDQAIGITLTGHDAATLLFAGTGPVIRLQNSADVTVEHLTIVRPTLEGNADGVGVEIRNCVVDVEVSDCVISMFQQSFTTMLPQGLQNGVGIQLAGVVQNVHLLRNAIAAGIGVGAKTSDNDPRICGIDVEIRENVLLGTKGVLITCLGFSGNIEQNGIVVVNGLGISLDGVTTARGAIIIDSNDIVTGGGGISFNTSATTVSNNTITGSVSRPSWTDPGVERRMASAILAGSASNIQSSTTGRFIGNRIALIPESAKIIGNRIANFRGHGIYFAGKVGSAMVKQNSISDAAGCGIGAETGAIVTRLSIENNDIIRAGLAPESGQLPPAGVWIVSGDDVDISHNRITGVPGNPREMPSHGIHLSAPKRVRMIGNSISGVPPSGVITTGDGTPSGPIVTPMPDVARRPGEPTLIFPGVSPGIVSAGIEIAGGYGTAEIVNNDIVWRSPTQKPEGDWQAIRIVSNLSPGTAVFTLLPDQLGTARIATEYLVIVGSFLFRLSSAEQALIVRSNVMQWIGMTSARPMVEINVTGTCTFGANDCRAVIPPLLQSPHPNPLVALTSETAIIDSNHLIGSGGNAMTLGATTSIWTVLGNVHQGPINVLAGGGLGTWANFNRSI